MPALRKAAHATPAEVSREQVERFLDSCRKPALLEPGEDPFPLSRGNFQLTDQPSGLLLEAWDNHRTLARRIVAIAESRPGRLTLSVHRFGGKTGSIVLTDTDRPQSAPALLRSSRHLLREHLRRWLARQFPGWRTAEITTGADLENTLSPACPRALLVRNNTRWAALAAPQDPATAATALTFGLIWLDYLRRREAPAPVEGLILFLPRGAGTSTLLRLRHLNVQCRLFHYDDTGFEAPVDPASLGNLITQLDPWQHSLPEPSTDADRWLRHLSLQPGVELIPISPGVRSLRIRGLEFARYSRGTLRMGIDRKRPTRSLESLQQLAADLATFRHPDAPVPDHPWLLRNPEAWLESVVRRNVSLLDASLLPDPVYGQVPALAGCDRAVMDLLAIDRQGRLAVIELKATEDPHLPLQSLDYWIHVAHHAARAGFTPNGYFPSLPVKLQPPRLLLVAPALQFHPTTEILLSYFSPQVQVERIGLGVEWQYIPRVVLRVSGARRPEWDRPDS